MDKQNGYYIGTSGWSYEGWIGNFYPEKIKSPEVLPCYTQTFDSVELNNSFYQLPKEKNIKKWLEQTPPEFVFSCKANRYITHMKKLEDVEESVDKLITAFRYFEDKLGAILFQFPPYWHIDIARLKKFIDYLPKDLRYTFEFRSKSWFCEALYFYDFKQYQTPLVVTADFIYIRMHGPEAVAYSGSYSEEKLQECARKILEWQKEKKPVYCYFDNDEKACAPKDAKRLREILRKQKKS
ncbi:hypothetical protein Lbir_2758 [Legionella birminghamensis]|uniref:Protein of uncharacterized function DUF72 n=1 Tax=Legionella birminghamensis TaxID=28083 RepID=A0A378IFZ7_9GAMM|nr:DUF72 domain-containing protein [Legionella birminghamensis]KTC68156.1 hypothetical protein Lbir_2758 [Legionella birminghamensis]STX31134.1 Protein of uncharacterised function DUF72 [Legionella birminghamensis]